MIAAFIERTLSSIGTWDPRRGNPSKRVPLEASGFCSLDLTSCMTSSSDNSSPAYKSCTGWFSYSGEEISQYAATMVSKMGRNTSIDLRLHFQAELGLTRYLVSDEVAGGEVEKLKPFSDKRPVGPLSNTRASQNNQIQRPRKLKTRIFQGRRPSHFSLNRTWALSKLLMRFVVCVEALTRTILATPDKPQLPNPCHLQFPALCFPVIQTLNTDWSEPNVCRNVRPPTLLPGETDPA
mmetsp:Transcript_31571/g.122262  ORF Transcript_31571/g.122262 Transcript_31571/m.122262 type:complete len:237 (-) Transcript_31571:492-1202(-)